MFKKKFILRGKTVRIVSVNILRQIKTGQGRVGEKDQSRMGEKGRGG